MKRTGLDQMFKLKTSFKPTGDQPQAIEKLVQGLKAGAQHQVLLGVTGSGKTFTIAKVIERVQRPVLIISPNKTLAAQLYQEFRDFFPENAVCYFVSYYDYYQPEAYVPQTATYIEKETEINVEINKLRLKATSNLTARRDVVVVASVSCIYNLGSPQAYSQSTHQLQKGQKIQRRELCEKLVQLQYERLDYDFVRGGFRTRGEAIDIFPADEETALRVSFEDQRIIKVSLLNPLTGEVGKSIPAVTIYPARHYLTSRDDYSAVFAEIRQDLNQRVKELEREEKSLEAHRLQQRTEYDLQMIQEVGYVNGIENYSRYFDGRAPGEPPYTLLDYFPKDFLVVVDESHLTVSQLRGMYAGDRSRKDTLIEYGFRLPSARDNRPLRFSEFLEKVNQIIYTSATPAAWEINQANRACQALFGGDHAGVSEQLIRPTGIVDPQVELKPTTNQVKDLVAEIKLQVKKGERTLVTTLTKRTAEDLADYLTTQKIKTHYLHAEIHTLDRSDILDGLRGGTYQVVVGINLLREGLDLPEVSLIGILDADKEGFLRSETSLIQTMGRATRNVQGRIIMYADTVTGSMRRAIEEVNRRRKVQLEYNREHRITPQTISKPIRSKLVARDKTDSLPKGLTEVTYQYLQGLDPLQLTPLERRTFLKTLRQSMHQAARDLDFETAIILRDKAKEVEGSIYG